ncbi:BZIP-type transcription factor MBZ1 [Hyphodiscus hymeniophilus]|uniref:BZIP-type transcription factor MBZ1 n=1 Tax=Hyphodiscus hymeniophilus TaxID=353542 RepID=A0A9P6VJ79_9HELO|nr:BZIP-type transcription factor MBZ1 [Hyphodiscus hymeniophilus]
MSSSTQSSSSSMSTSNTQANCLDPLDSLIDFSEYETVSYKSEYKSPTLSPSTSKSGFSRAVSSTPATLPSSQPTLSGPSHNYELYRQTTGIPPGSVANTLAVNQSMNQYGFTDSYLAGLSPNDDFVDFGTAPRQTPFHPSDVDMEFDTSSNEPAFFYPEQTSEFVDPSAIGGNNGLPAPQTLPTQSGIVGRLWPGMHQQQAAIAKAQAQQKQQQAIITQQRQQAMAGQSRQQSQRPRASHAPSDPIVEEKISQLLNSMRQSSVTTDGGDADTSNGNMSHASRMRKDEEEMDEDERLLASEEGKKLSSKERRQLRNKVSARAFRSRRKEYISQLEGEIAAKVDENTDLRTQNRALMDENTRLSDLTRMLLSSPSFSGFLDTLSQNPTAQQQPASTPAPVERKVRKDVNPYAAQQQMQHQHVGMTMVPEHTMDFSMLDINSDGGFSYQPQVFSVLSVPETILDAEALSGKGRSFTPLASDDEKVELPIVERAPISEPTTIEEIEVVDAEFDADPAFALFTTAPKSTSNIPTELNITALLAGITIEKPCQYELVVESAEDVASAEAAMKKVERMCASLVNVTERLRAFTMDL